MNTSEDCIICKSNIVYLDALCTEGTFPFLRSRRFFKIPLCDKCGYHTTVKKYKGKLYWCYIVRNEEVQCFYRKSVYKSTWLERSKLSVKQVVVLVKLYLEPHFQCDQVAQILQVNKNTITDWTNFIREIISDWKTRKNRRRKLCCRNRRS